MDISSIEIETPRLRLRPPRRADFEGFARFTADPESTRYLGGPRPRAAAWRNFLTMAGAWYVQGFAMFSVIDKKSGEWLGRVGPWFPEGWPGPEVGWGIVSEHCGRGYATEAAAAAIDWAFATLNWHEVVHVIDVENAASQAVARKLGSSNRGRTLLPEPFDKVAVELWGQTKEQWQARRASVARAPQETA